MFRYLVSAKKILLLILDSHSIVNYFDKMLVSWCGYLVITNKMWIVKLSFSLSFKSSTGMVSKISNFIVVQML